MQLPELGQRGEGWVAMQALLLGATVVAGFLATDWPDSLRRPALVTGVLLAVGAAAMLWQGLRMLAGGLTPLPRPPLDARLVAEGIYGTIRHPLYGGLLLGALGWSLAMASAPALACTLLLAVFFDLKARREEVWLEEQLPEYAHYRQRVPRRLIPWLY